MGACLIWACSISKLRKYCPRMDRVLTPQQQCLLLFFLKLPVDQATSKIPTLCERCWYTLDTGLLLKAKRPIGDLTTELDTACIWKPKCQLEALPLSKNPDQTWSLQIFEAKCDEITRCRWVSFNMPPMALCALTTIEEYGCMIYTYCWGGE